MNPRTSAALANFVEYGLRISKPSSRFANRPKGHAVFVTISTLVTDHILPSRFLQQPSQNSLKHPSKAAGWILNQVVTVVEMLKDAKGNNEPQSLNTNCLTKCLPIGVRIHVRQQGPNATIKRREQQKGAVLFKNILHQLPTITCQQIIAICQVHRLTVCPPMVLGCPSRSHKGTCEGLEDHGRSEIKGAKLPGQEVLLLKSYPHPPICSTDHSSVFLQLIMPPATQTTQNIVW